jgi:hypothetical protein
MSVDGDPVIHVPQVIYTNVEASSSPSRKSGFQFLFRTEGALTEGEMGDVERRLRYETSGDQPVKHLFFSTAAAKYAVGRIVPLKERDQYGRAGLYFAHVLVFGAGDFERVGNDPFRVFRTFEFWSHPREALAAGDRDTGHIIAAPVRVAEPARADLRDNRLEKLDARQRHTLLALALRSPRMNEEPRNLAFYGSAADAYACLESLFAVLPAPLRRWCTFDTYFAGGSLSQSPYWAIGLPAGEYRSPALIAFDLGTERFERKPALIAGSAVERWFAGPAGEATSLATLADQAVPAYWLGEWCEGRGADLEVLSRLDRPLFDAFIAANRPQVEERARQRLGEKVSPRLAATIRPHAMQWLLDRFDLETVALEPLKEGFRERDIIKWLSLEYLVGRRRPDREELRELAAWFSHPLARDLRLVILRWAQDWTRLASVVRRLPLSEYLRFVDWALRTLPAGVEGGVEMDEGEVRVGFRIRYEDDASGESRLLLTSLLMPGDEAPANGAAAQSRRWWPFRGSQSGDGTASPFSRVAPERLLGLLSLLADRPPDDEGEAPCQPDPKGEPARVKVFQEKNR